MSQLYRESTPLPPRQYIGEYAFHQYIRRVTPHPAPSQRPPTVSGKYIGGVSPQNVTLQLQPLAMKTMLNKLPFPSILFFPQIHLPLVWNQLLEPSVYQ